MLTLAILVTAGVALLLYVGQNLQQYSALKGFNGPRIAAFTRLWLLRANSSGEMNKAFTSINDQYGKHGAKVHLLVIFPFRTRACQMWCDRCQNDFFF